MKKNDPMTCPGQSDQVPIPELKTTIFYSSEAEVRDAAVYMQERYRIQQERERERERNANRGDGR